MTIRFLCCDQSRSFQTRMHEKTENFCCVTPPFSLQPSFDCRISPSVASYIQAFRFLFTHLCVASRKSSRCAFDLHFQVGRSRLPCSESVPVPARELSLSSLSGDCLNSSNGSAFPYCSTRLCKQSYSMELLYF